MLIIFFSAVIAKSSHEKDTFSDINTDEWECPSCSFLVQVAIIVFIAVQENSKINKILKKK